MLRRLPLSFSVCLILIWSYDFFKSPHVPQSEKFCFDWFFKSRSPQELNKRGDTLIKLIQREYGEAEAGSGRKVYLEGMWRGINRVNRMGEGEEGWSCALDLQF